MYFNAVSRYLMDKLMQIFRLNTPTIYRVERGSLLATHFGIHLSACRVRPGTGRAIVSVSRPLTDATPPNERHHYRLLPDWQTSYLWYNVSAPIYGDGHRPEVELTTIDEKYPELAPFFWRWRNAHEAAFEQQGCDRGLADEPFPDPRDKVAWEVAGFFIACCLILDGDAESVTYVLASDIEYHITGMNMDETLRSFLMDQNALL